MSIKYYRLAKGEEPPEEFCAVRDIGGEPSEYTFYAPEAENAKLRERVAELEELTDGKLYIPQEWYQLAMTQNAKLREFATETWELLTCNEPVFVWKGLQELASNLGIEVDG